MVVAQRARASRAAPARTPLEPSLRLGRMTLALGAAFLAVAFYLTLAQIAAPSRGSHGTRQPLEALQRLSPTELRDALDAARSALAGNPLDASLLIDVSRIAQVQGDRETAERLKLIAGAMTPRDTEVQAEALSMLLRRRDFDAAMSRLDGLIRARPAQARAFFAVAGEIAADPDGCNAVARMLAQSPPWREDFMSSLLARGEADSAYNVIAALRALGAGYDPSDLASVIAFHLRQGNLDRAYALWLASLSAAELNDVLNVYDGGFAHDVRNLHFDWTITPAPGLSYRTAPRNSASMDMALQVEFSGFQGSFANLSQVLRLRPARYRLAGEARFEGFQSPTSLVFRVYCMNAGALHLVAETLPLPQSSQWITFERSLTIPPSDCDAQLLRLESKIKLEDVQTTMGLASIDGVKIERLPDLVP